MIGVFDSGIGGVTVLKELLKILPHEKFIYYSDSLNNPYGDKSFDELKKIVFKVVDTLIEKNCKIIVIACNTASTLSTCLRGKYSTPIVAIEPAYKMIYDNDFSEKTLVMATKATINSDKFQQLYHKYDNHNTTLLSCSGLADLVEEGNQKKIDNYLKNTLMPYRGVKCVVLGCTHYPLIKENIRKVLGDVKFYDGSVGVSKQTRKILLEKDLINENGDTYVQFIDSSNDLKKKKRFFSLLGDLKF